MRIIIYLLILIFAVNAIAQAETGSISQQPIDSKIHERQPILFLISTGAEGRLDQNIRRENIVQRLSNYSFGFQKETSRYLLEKSQFEEESGNRTLSIGRKFQNYLLWGSYVPSINSWSDVYIGGGLGGYQDSIETRLGDVRKENKSDWKALLGFHFGISAHISVFSASLEMRALFGDELDRQPQIAGVARVGLRF